MNGTTINIFIFIYHNYSLSHSYSLFLLHSKFPGFFIGIIKGQKIATLHTVTLLKVQQSTLTAITLAAMLLCKKKTENHSIQNNVYSFVLFFKKHVCISRSHSSIPKAIQ